jgi:hypothetical protein
MARVFSSRDLNWKGDQLYCGNRRLLRIVPDQKYPGVMWRVEMPDGALTDMVNRTRAKDAAVAIGLKILNQQETSPAASPVR